MPKHNLVSYNVLLSTYGLYRQSDKALNCYDQMLRLGYRPDDKTYVALLHTLSQTPNKINDVKRIYFNIEENKRGPMLTAAMIASLTQAQLVDEVNELLKKLPKENILFYSIKANLKETNGKFNYPILITDQQLAVYDLLMSNMYTYAGLNDRLTIVDEVLYKNDKLRKIVSCAWFENSNGKIEYFKSENSQLENCQHTERLALTHALEEQKKFSSPILIGKNHRICTECHDYYKKASLSSIPKKDIYLRDSTRFHLFSSGVCSCEVTS